MSGLFDDEEEVNTPATTTPEVGDDSSNIRKPKVARYERYMSNSDEAEVYNLVKSGSSKEDYHDLLGQLNENNEKKLKLEQFGNFITSKLKKQFIERMEKSTNEKEKEKLKEFVGKIDSALLCLKEKSSIGRRGRTTNSFVNDFLKEYLA